MHCSMLPVCTAVYSEKADIPLSYSETLPDYLPDISRIVGADCAGLHCTAVTDNDGIRLTAAGKVDMIYLSEGKGLLKPVSFPVTIDKLFDRFPASEHPSCRISAVCQIGRITTVMQSPRSVEIRTSVTMSVTAYEDTITDLDTFPHDELCLHGQKTTAVCRNRFEGQFDLQNDIRLENDMPSAAETVLAQYYVNTRLCHIDGSRIRVAGVIVCKLMYRSESDTDTADADYVYLTKELPYETDIEADDPRLAEASDLTLIPQIQIVSDSVTVNFDSYGENRVLRLTLGCRVCVHAAASCEVCCYDDVFSPSYSITPAYGTHLYEAPVCTFDETLTDSQSIPTDAAKLTVISDTAVRLTGGSVEVVDGRYLYCADAVLTVFGSDGSGMPVSLSASLSLKLPLSSCPDAAKGVCHALFCAETDSCSASIRAGMIESVLRIHVKGILLEQKKLTVIDDVTVDTDAGKRSARAAYIFCYPTEPKPLWEIAKHYEVPADVIASANDLTDNTVEPGRALLIPDMV